MNKDVLIIDDEPWFFDPFLDRLDFEKISYGYCKNGSEGLKKLQTNIYKLVVLDMKVSLGDEYQDIQGYDPPGLYLLEKIKMNKPYLPVICYTVLTDGEIVSKIEGLGGKHIPKGTGDENLISNIKILIDTLYIDHLILGNQALENGNYELAEIQFRQEILKTVNNVNALVGLARTYLTSGRLKEALRAIDEALKLDQKNPRFNNLGQLWMIKAEILIDLGQYKEAEILLKEILKLNPDYIKAKLLLEDYRRIESEKKDKQKSND
jgi:tetratricopeptide (TPR) repeat protein